MEGGMTMTWRRKLGFIAATGMVSAAIVLILGECLVRLLNPTETMYPRLKASIAYGNTLYENSKMEHELSGKWRFIYTINEYQYRGRAVPISNSYSVPNIVVLGDSYAFGEGVQDDETFPEVMAADLRGRYGVVNLGVPGWGLTQETRRFYEFGKLYNPAYVILEFCANDPEDDLEVPVTVVRDSRLQFLPCPDNEGLGIKKYLSGSYIQKSQLYNFVAAFGFRHRHDLVAEHKVSMATTPGDLENMEERYYNQLLETFARDLAGSRTRLLMIAVNGQLGGFPLIRKKIAELEKEGVLTYLETEPWFANVRNYGSPEGHAWGAKADSIVGQAIASYVMKESSSKMTVAKEAGQ
jgi:hypothetical protein